MTTSNLTQGQINDFNTTLQANFRDGLAVQNPDWQKVAMQIGSNARSNTYAFLSQFPSFREWVGSRLHKTAKERAYSVDNKPYENTLDVPRIDFDDNNLSMYGGVAKSYGEAISDLKNQLVFDLIKSGFGATCYDGQFFFDTDHPVYPNEDGTGTAASVSNMQAGAGEPWVLLCTKRAPKAFYLQERDAAEFYAKTDASSDRVFETDVFTYGGRWRGNAAFGFWQLAFGSKAALDAANFNAAFKNGMLLKGDGNRRLGIVYDTLLVGPDNLAAAEALLKAQQGANGASNTNYNKVQLIVTPWLSV